MAHLWIQTDGSEDWAVVPLGASRVFVGRDGRPSANATDKDTAVGVLLRAGDCEIWMLAARDDGGVRLNGAPVPGGLAQLRDRDEIRAPTGARIFFSTEKLVAVAPFPDGLTGSVCPRCKQPLEPGHHAVRCPQCGIWHHELEDLSCWTYAESCALCDQKTDLKAGYRWTPEGL